MMPNPCEAESASGQQQQDASLHQAAWPDMLSSLHVAYGDLARTKLELERRMSEIDETRELFERVIESMSEALFLMDVAGRIIRTNRAAGALLECELATLVGQLFVHMCPTADVPATPWRLLERAPNGVLTDIDVELRSQSGRVIPVNMSCVLVRDRQGKVKGVMAMARDITARLQAEAAQRELQKQLVQASRRAGMADVAANVLHNVGNVLNSVNISAGLVTSTMSQSPIGDVGRITALLHEHAPALGDYLTSDPKGKQVPTYLVALGDHLTQERTSVLKELSSLSSKIEHIRQIISMQQDITQVGGLQVEENLAELMDEALAINFASLERHHIEIIREYAEIPLIVLDRHPVLQILVNLISNAKYAMLELPDRPHQ
jgi:two-component system, LuxR family, sensor kinase FixL